MKISLLFSLCVLFLISDVQAQFYQTQYRPPGQQWQQLQSERFRVIYPERYQEIAEQTLSILELEYDDVQTLVGGELRNFPVILNPENDRSNGFVAPFNFRSEVEIAPIIGKSLNPRSGDWLETVVPHELVHALHFSVNPPSIVRPLGLFSPDVRRSIHAAAPMGFLEGIAVEHESHNTIPGSGRGNYPYFNNQLLSMIGGDNPWSMGQLVHSTTFTPPFNRHYIGGYAFVNWLQENEGDDAMRKAIRRHYQLPLLGFGFALRTTTGQWPGELYDEFMQEQYQTEKQQMEDIAVDTDAITDSIPFNGTCRRTNRPMILNSGKILFFGRACNKSTGFYLYDHESGNTRFLYEVSIVEDHHYSLTPDGESIIYSRYHSDPKYDNQFRADLHILNIKTAENHRLTKNQRLATPSFVGNQLFATQNDGSVRRLVSVDPQSGTILRTYPLAENSTTVSVAPNINESDQIAILGKKHGVQGIWFEDIETDETLFARPPDIVFERASIFDPVWAPDGERLLFTTDAAGAMNIYEFEEASQQINQLTDSRYSAFEGTYSPDGERITYILQREDEQLPVMSGTARLFDRRLDTSEWAVTETVESDLNRPLLNRNQEMDRSQWNQSRYSTGLSWLKPRLWLPTAERMAGDADRIGITVESVDRMSRHSYSLEVSRFANAFWFDGTYRYTGRYPGFELDLFNSPSISTFRISEEGEEESFLFSTIAQQRGGTFSVPFRYRLEQNVRFSSFLIRPLFTISQTRFTDITDAQQPVSDFEDPLYTAGLNTVLNYRLRQYTRDVQPNAGISLFTQTRYGLNSSPFTLQLPDGEVSSTFSQRKGFRAGAIGYVAPLQRFNQSLRLSAQIFTQTPAPVFNTQSVISNLFDSLAAPGATNIGILDTRYTIPLIYPDEGGLLLPVYLSNIYLVLFSQTVTDLNRPESETRTVLGTGIRSQFKLGNLHMDLGFSVGWEPAAGNVNYLFGNF